MDEMKLNWADLELFLAVARSGGLAGAVQTTGLSAPSLGRHMVRLEYSLGETLFLRHARGYELTEAGMNLVAEAEVTEASVNAIERRIKKRSIALPVNISAGTWMSYFLIRHIAEIEASGIRLVFSPDEAGKHIGRREATIGLRNFRPDEPSIAIRKTTRVAFASYASPVGAESGDWIASTLMTPSANWVRANHRDRIKLEASHPRTVFDLALRDRGQVVLPCFVGDAEPRLFRTSEVILSLTHDQWLVAHGADRDDANVRKTIDRIVSLIKARQSLFEGDHARSTE